METKDLLGVEDGPSVALLRYMEAASGLRVLGLTSIAVYFGIMEQQMEIMEQQMETTI